MSIEFRARSNASNHTRCSLILEICSFIEYDCSQDAIWLFHICSVLWARSMSTRAYADMGHFGYIGCFVTNLFRCIGNYYYNQETSKFDKKRIMFCNLTRIIEYSQLCSFKHFLSVLTILSFSLTHSDHFVTVLLAVWAWALLNRQN